MRRSRALLLATVPVIAVGGLLFIALFGGGVEESGDAQDVPPPHRVRAPEAPVTLTPPASGEEPAPVDAPPTTLPEAPEPEPEPEPVVAEVEPLAEVETGVRGRVVDESGAPVAGVTIFEPTMSQSSGGLVLTASGRFPEDWNRFLKTAKTNAEGRFALALAPGQRRVLAYGPGYDMRFSKPAQVTPGAVAELPDIVVAALPTGRLDITITRAGAPYEGEVQVTSMPVWIDGRQVYAYESWRCDAQGRVRPKPSWLAGRYQVKLQCSAGSVDGLEVEVPREGERALKVELPETPRCELTVVDIETGAPVPEVDLMWRKPGDTDWTRSGQGKTDKQGKVWIHSLEAGTWLIQCWTGEVLTLGFRGQPQASQASLEVGVEPLTARVLEVTRPPLLRGVVLDKSGAPVAKAEVRGAAYGNQEPRITDAQGRFELRAGNGGEELVATHPAHGRAQGTLPADRSELVTLRFGKGLKLVGQVFGPAGALENASVELGLQAMHAAAFGGDESCARTRTDAEGRFEVSLPQGYSILSVSARGHKSVTRGYVVAGPNDAGPEPGEAMPSNVTVLREGEVAPALELVLEAGGQLRGKVRGSKPASGAWLVVATCDSPLGLRQTVTAITDEEGRFVMESVPEGQATLIAYDDEGTASDPQTAKPGDEVTLTMRPVGRIKGELVDGRGEPVTQTYITIVSTSAAGQPIYGYAFADAKGRFEARIAGEAAAVQLMVQGYRTFNLDPRELVAGGTATVTVRLDAGAVVRGRYLGEDGRGVPGAFVMINPVDANDVSSVSFNSRAETDGEGRFEIRGLGPGSWQLYAFSPGTGGTPATPRDFVLAEGQAELDLGDLSLAPATQDASSDGR